jgi:YYY domain-containing protein
MRDALAWYIVVQVTGLAVWPLVARALAPLEDRGWAVSKVAGLLGVAWLVWFVCMLTPLPFTRTTLIVALLVIGAGAWLLELRTRGIEPVLNWLRDQQRSVLAFEIIFLGGFILFAVLRAHAPAVAATEKPMDMAFLNGFMAAQTLPTQDTWMAGMSVPYYHFGYFVLACLGKITGAPPGVAYNLAAATVPALAMVSLAALAWNLARAAGVAAPWAIAGSGVATLLALVCGNLSTFFEFLLARGVVSADASQMLGINPKHFGNSVTPGLWPPIDTFWWFNASRVIPNLQPDGINEFPFFSALLSDLHPHFMALPFELLVLTCAAAHVLSRGATLRSAWTQGLAVLALGGLLVINTWDIAPFWLLYVGLSLYAAYFSEWRWRWLAAALPPLAGALVYAPYFVGYAGPPLGLGIVTGDRTPLGSLLVLFAWAIVLLAALGVFTRWCVGDRRGWQITAGGAFVGVALAVLGQPGLGLLVALVATLLPWPGVLERFDPAAAMVVGVGAFAAVMLLGVEVVFLDDVFHSRMNTVFKFHENAWLLAGLASGVGLALVGRFTLRARWIVAACAAVFLVAGMVYPLSAIATRMREQPPDGPNLDGIAFLSPDDRAAVRWLSAQNGPRGRVVIAEGVGDEYDSSAAAMATYSGAATVVGWAGHELQWRGPLPELGSRQSDLAALYRDVPVDAIRPIVDRYAVRYVVVRDVERKKYGDTVTSRFDGVLPVAFRAGSTVIYRAR